jgi:hypothetical protein
MKTDYYCLYYYSSSFIFYTACINFVDSIIIKKLVTACWFFSITASYVLSDLARSEEALQHVLLATTRSVVLAACFSATSQLQSPFGWLARSTILQHSPIVEPNRRIPFVYVSCKTLSMRPSELLVMLSLGHVVAGCAAGTYTLSPDSPNSSSGCLVRLDVTRFWLLLSQQNSYMQYRILNWNWNNTVTVT